MSLIDPDDDHDRIYGKRYDKTGQWLLQNPKFKDWETSPATSLLWCYGGRKFYPCILGSTNVS